MKASYKMEVRKSFNLRKKANKSSVIDAEDECDLGAAGLEREFDMNGRSFEENTTPPRLLSDFKLNVKRGFVRPTNGAVHSTSSNSSPAPSSHREEFKEALDNGAYKFDLTKPLTDQVKQIFGGQKQTVSADLVPVNAAQQVEPFGQSCTEDSDSFMKKFKFTRIDCELSLRKRSLPPATGRACSFSCISDYLNYISASCVPIDAFNHVVFQYKYFKNPNLVTNSSNSGHQHIQHQLPLNCKENFIKFEYVYGDRKYWIVKIRKVYEDLFQLKFFRTLSEHISSTNSKQNVSSAIPRSNKPVGKVKKKAPVKKSPLKNKTNNAMLLNCDESFSSLACSFSSFGEKSLDSRNHKGSMLFFSSSLLDSETIDQRLRPMGWSKKHGFSMLRPPTPRFASELFNDDFQPIVQVKPEDKTFLSYFRLDSIQHQPTAHQIFHYYKENVFCELQDEQTPRQVNIMYIKRNVAGRLLLEYLQEMSTQSQLWINHLNLRVHPLGWARTNDCVYDPVEINCIISKHQHLKKLFESENEEQIGPETVESSTPTGPSKSINKRPKKQTMNPDHETYKRHDFKINYMMECLYKDQFYVGKVVEILNEFYFVVEIETIDGNIRLTLHKNSVNQMRDNSCHTLFPCKWCEKKNLVLTPPMSWPAGEAFDWDKYIEIANQGLLDTSPKHVQITDADLFDWSPGLKQLSEKFQLGMYLECVDPRSPSGGMCLAQIRAKVDHLLFLHIVSQDEVRSSLQRGRFHLRSQSEERYFIFPVDSHNLFPTNWHDMNDLQSSMDQASYSIKFPVEKPNDQPQSEDEDLSFIRIDFSKIPILSRFRYRYNWCPALYLNSEFNSGPHLMKAKLNLLPKKLGPGPIALLLGQLVQFLMSASEKPQQLLKLVPSVARRQGISNKRGSDDFQKVFVRLKDKAIKNSMKEIWVCTQSNQLPEFIQQLCYNLKCCTRLISLSESPASPDSSPNVCRTKKCCFSCSVNYELRLLEEWNQLLNKSLLRRQYMYRRAWALLNKSREEALLSAKSEPQGESAKLDSNLGEKLPQKRRSTEEQTDHLKQAKFNRQASLGNPPKSRKEKGQGNLYKQELIRQFSNNTEMRNGFYQAQPAEKSSKVRFQQASRSTNDSSVSSATESSVSDDEISIKNLPSIVNLNHLAYRFAFNGLAGSVAPVPNTVKVAEVASNPLNWSIDDLCDFLLKNALESSVIDSIKNQSIDGQSFLMLNLPIIHEHMNLKLGPAIKLANVVENVKLAYIQQFKK